MSKFKFVAITAFLFLPFLSIAQGSMDGKLVFLVNSVCDLRHADEKTYSLVQERLSSNDDWTPMNETGSFKEGECHPYDNVPGFKLNRLLSLIATSRKTVYVHGDMLNGENENYDYSLYERSVHANAKVSYTIKGREGRQCFVIVPYDEDGGDLSASIRIGEGDTIDFVKTEGGLLTAFIDNTTLETDDPVTIIVVGGNRDQSFVILNHNMRKK
jgi:hypothetical protein